VTIQNFNELVKNHNFAKKALSEFDNSSEKSIIDWLIKYEKSNLSFLSGYEKTENWQKTNLIIFTNGETFFETAGEIQLYKNVLVDIKEYKESIQFSDLFSKYYWVYEKSMPQLKNYLKSMEILESNYPNIYQHVVCILTF
jgi:hypothetical protein